MVGHAYLPRAEDPWGAQHEFRESLLGPEITPHTHAISLELVEVGDADARIEEECSQPPIKSVTTLLPVARGAVDTHLAQC